jgi:eukaryotic-like serine/threonine-protein kinase
MDVAPTAPAAALVPSSPCLSDDDAAALVGDSLDAAQRRVLGDHIDQCDRCRRFVSALIEAELPTEQAIDRGAAGATGLRAGDTLGRFKLSRLLGHGAMGEVWAARDPELDREVALKLLRLRPGALGVEATTRMRREAQAMARLNHANVVTIHELGTDGADRVFCAMELVEGVTLRGWLATPRTWRAVMAVARAVGHGVVAAHAAGLIHRDIKPENILIADDGRTLVSDFGLAKLADLGAGDQTPPSGGAAARRQAPVGDVHASAPVTSAPSGDLTTVGTVIGTPVYMAPEQLAGKPDARSDQFSYCVTIYEALFGMRPFGGASLDELETAIARGPDRPADLRGVPRGVLRCLVRGLAAAPEARWPAMAALVDALDHAARAPRRRRIALGVAGAAAVAAAAFALVGARSPDACASGARLIDELWSPAARITQIGQLTALDPRASVSVASATQLVDDWARAWRLGRRDACTVDEPQRTARLDCLDRGLHDLRAQLAVWRAGDRGVLEAAVRAASELPDVRGCVAEAGRPLDPFLSEQIARTDALVRSGRAVAARAQLGAMLAVAEATRQPRDLAIALVSATRAERDVGELTAARDHLARAAREAGRASDDRTLLDALIDEAAVIVELGQPLVSLGLLDAAQALDERSGARASRRISVTRGGALQQAGRTAEAIATLRTALPAVELDAAGDARARLLLGALFGKLSAALRQIEDYEGARAAMQRSLAIYEASLGPSHPEVAHALGDLASCEVHLMHYAEAKAHLARARAIALDTFGEHHVLTGSLELGSAHIAEFERRFADARADYEAARVAFTNVLPPDHPRFAIVEAGLGELEREADRCKEAIPHFERSLHITEVSGHDPRDHALHLIDLGYCLADVGRIDEGRNVLTRAIAELDDLHMDKRWYSEPYAALADLEAAAGHRAAAIELERKAIDALRDDPRSDAVRMRVYEQEQLDAWTKPVAK